MDINTDRLLATVSRLRTPMALAGLVVVLLYLLFRQLLGSRVLSPLTSDGTLRVVDRIVTSMFVLALVAIVLGFAGFVLAPLLRRAATGRAAAAQLVDASVDPQLEVVAGPETGEVTDLSFQHGALDFKFVNRGRAAAFLHRFDLEVVSVVPDRRPHLAFTYMLRDPFPGNRAGRRLQLLATNRGWGDAVGCRVSLTDPLLARIFPPASRTATVDVGSGAEQVEVLSLDVADADEAELRDLLARRAGLLDRAIGSPAEALAESDRLGLLSFFEREDVRTLVDAGGLFADQHRASAVERLREVAADRLPLPTPSVTVTYADGASDESRAFHEVTRTRPGGVSLWLSVDRFGGDWVEIAAHLMPSDQAYAVIVQPVVPQLRSYRMSRVIDPGAADRFHVLLAAEQSGDYTVRLVFHVNDNTVTSEPLQVYLKRLRNEPLPRQLTDGASLQLEDGRLVLG